jgi:hypothetical protein
LTSAQHRTEKEEIRVGDAKEREREVPSDLMPKAKLYAIEKNPNVCSKYSLKNLSQQNINGVSFFVSFKGFLGLGLNVYHLILPTRENGGKDNCGESSGRVNGHVLIWLLCSSDQH